MADESTPEGWDKIEGGTETSPEPEAKADETKAEAFKRLASYRVQKLLERIRLLGSLSNRSAYDYTPDQIAKIEEAILTEIGSTMKRFRGGDKDKPLFKLD